MPRSNPSRVFIGLVEVAGYYSRLKRGLEELDMEVSFVTIQQHTFDYGGDDTDRRWFTRWLRKLCIRWNDLWDSEEPLDRFDSLKLTLLAGAIKILQAITFVWAASRHDVFVLTANSGFFLNLPYNPRIRGYPGAKLLNRLGKRVVYNFHGADSYAPYLDGRTMRRNHSGETMISLVDRRRTILKRIEEVADVVMNSPLRGHLLTRSYVSNWLIGLPMDLPEEEIEPPPESTCGNGPVRILHAPSSPLSKGTPFIRGVIDQLEEDGLNIEYTEISGEPNRVVLETLKEIDLVVDQVFSTGPMPGLATEAAYFGKPTVSCGYYVHELEDAYPDPEYVPPVHAAAPDELYVAIRRLVEDDAYRRRLGREAREFVRARWRPARVAERFARILRDDVPEDWWVDPAETTYLHGYGMTEAQAKEYVGRLLEYAGRSALGLDDKPQVASRFVDFALGTDERELRYTRSVRSMQIVVSMTNRARRAILDENYEDARRMLKNCLNTHPNHPRPYLLLALIAQRENEVEKTADYLQAASRIDPDEVRRFVKSRKGSSSE